MRDRLSPSALLIGILVGAVSAPAGETHADVPAVTIDAVGTVHLPAMSVPLSPLSSDEAKRNFLDFVRGFASLSEGAAKDEDIKSSRKRLDDLLMRPGVEKLRAVFPVHIRPEVIGGVKTDIIEPLYGVAPRNRNRVLINLHGGGFQVGARFGGQMESIPIASIGKIKVITVDYREGPENRFPAASEDVAKVYVELLKRYPPRNIGIYGCSSGGVLAAESVAWFQTHGLPRPGAIGMFGGGALADEGQGHDSSYTGSALMGWPLPPMPRVPVNRRVPYYDIPGFDVRDPMVSPVYSPSVLGNFPPSLLISGTRDMELSPVVYTHAQLVKVGVEADLHVWEGAVHCSYAQPVVDPDVPETREAWNVIVKFFEAHLGRKRSTAHSIAESVIFRADLDKRERTYGRDQMMSIVVS